MAGAALSLVAGVDVSGADAICGAGKKKRICVVQKKTKLMKESSRYSERVDDPDIRIPTTTRAATTEEAYGAHGASLTRRRCCRSRRRCCGCCGLTGDGAVIGAIFFSLSCGRRRRWRQRRRRHRWGGSAGRLLRLSLAAALRSEGRPGGAEDGAGFAGGIMTPRWTRRRRHGRRWNRSRRC